MGKCRSALQEENGDLEKAVEWLRKKGIKSMEKRASDNAEALLASHVSESSCAIVEILAETDFVTRHALFQQLSASVASTLAASPQLALCETGQTLSSAPLVLCQGADEQQLVDRQGKAIGDALLEVGSVLGERLSLGRRWYLGNEAAFEGVVMAGYAHTTSTGSVAGTGRMAAIVKVKAEPAGSPEQADRLRAVAGQLARHIVAGQPRFVSIESIPAEVLEKERGLMRDAHLSAMDPSKAKKLTEEMLTKVVDGKTKKFYQDQVLLCQECILPSANSDAAAKVPLVERWLQQEADAIGVKSIVVEQFHFASL